MSAAAAPAANASAPAAPAAVAAPPACSQRTWFGKCAVVFRDLKLQSGAGGAALPLEAVCAASRLMAESYGFMFGAKGMVTGVLNKDVEENTGGLERAAAKLRASAPQGALSTPARVEELLALECVAGGEGRAGNCPAHATGGHPARRPPRLAHCAPPPSAHAHTLPPLHLPPPSRLRAAGCRPSPWRPFGARARSAR